MGNQQDLVLRTCGARDRAGNRASLPGRESARTARSSDWPPLFQRLGVQWAGKARVRLVRDKSGPPSNLVTRWGFYEALLVRLSLLPLSWSWLPRERSRGKPLNWGQRGIVRTNSATCGSAGWVLMARAEPTCRSLPARITATRSLSLAASFRSCVTRIVVR